MPVKEQQVVNFVKQEKEWRLHISYNPQQCVLLYCFIEVYNSIYDDTDLQNAL